MVSMKTNFDYYKSNLHRSDNDNDNDNDNNNNSNNLMFLI